MPKLWHNTLSVDSQKTELWLSIDKLSSILWTSSGLMATQDAATYIVTMDYAAHSLLEWLL